MFMLLHGICITPFNILNAEPKGPASVNVVRQRYIVTDKLPFIRQ